MSYDSKKNILFFKLCFSFPSTRMRHLMTGEMFRYFPSSRMTINTKHQNKEQFLWHLSLANTEYSKVIRYYDSQHGFLKRCFYRTQFLAKIKNYLPPQSTKEREIFHSTLPKLSTNSCVRLIHMLDPYKLKVTSKDEYIHPSATWNYRAFLMEPSKKQQTFYRGQYPIGHCFKLSATTFLMISKLQLHYV